MQFVGLKHNYKLKEAIVFLLKSDIEFYAAIKIEYLDSSSRYFIEDISHSSTEMKRIKILLCNTFQKFVWKPDNKTLIFINGGKSLSIKLPQNKGRKKYPNGQYRFFIEPADITKFGEFRNSSPIFYLR